MMSNDNVPTIAVPMTEITEQQTEGTGYRNHLQPINAVEALLKQMECFPLVALGEVHQLQEFYDFLSALLYHPLFPEKITDIVVEFGNARYQEVADHFLLTDQPVAKSDLQQIWHTAKGSQ